MKCASIVSFPYFRVVHLTQVVKWDDLVDFLALLKLAFLFSQNEYSHRRMSDPSSNWNYFLQGSLKRNGVRKSRSETVNVDGIGENGCAEVEANNIEDGKLPFRQFLFHMLLRFYLDLTVFCTLFNASFQNYLYKC
jgi:hypothetical protein